MLKCNRTVSYSNLVSLHKLISNQTQIDPLINLNGASSTQGINQMRYYMSPVYKGTLSSPVGISAGYWTTERWPRRQTCGDWGFAPSIQQVPLTS